MDNSRHFALCFDEKFAQYAAVCIRSIVMHNKCNPVEIHVLSDFLTKETVKNLEDAAQIHFENNKLTIHIVDDDVLSTLPQGMWPVHAWYRILLPEILPEDIDRVLYLDCDTLVLSDLSELFKISLSEKAFAAVADPQSFYPEAFLRCGYPNTSKYVCSGVMLFNLQYWRKNRIKEQLISTASEKKQTLKFPDQDALNITCKDRIIVLPLKYGIMDGFFTDQEINTPENVAELTECLESPMIVHFASMAPWLHELRPSLYSREWDRINSTLKHKAKVKYISRGMRWIRMVGYKILHPAHAYNKRKKKLTKKKAYKLLLNNL